MVMSDEKIRKKLYLGITANYNISLRKNNFEITLNRYFSDVTKKYNGNTLLHYVAELYRNLGAYSIDIYFDSIKILLERGIALDEKNVNGKDFLQIICNENSDSLYSLEYLKRFFVSYRDFSIYELINNRDDDRNSIMQIILNNLKIKITALYNSKGNVTKKVDEIEKMFKVIKDIFEYLVDNDYNQISITNSEENDIFELVKSMQLNNTWEKDLMSIYYRKNPVEFATLYFTDDRNDNLSKVKNYLQIEPESFKKSDILFVCQDNRRPYAEKINAVRKFLELGFDPNSKKDGETFIEYATKNKAHRYVNYINDITKLAIQYGLDTNNCNIIKTMVKANYNSDYISLIKILIEQNGCKKNIDSLNVRIDTFHNVLIQICRKVDMDYNYKELIDKEFVKFFFEIVDCYSFNNDLVNDYDFIEQTIMQIKEERNNSVVLNNNPITQLEVINALRTIITKRTDDKFNKFLVKNS